MLPGFWYAVGPLALFSVVADQLRRGSLDEMSWVAVAAALLLAYFGAWIGAVLRRAVQRRLEERF